METQDVLVVGSILLCCGCLGLLVVHLGSPVLKGLGWLAGAFIAGTLAVTAILAARSNLAESSLLAADTFILLAFVSLQMSFFEITGHPRLPRLGLMMVVLQCLLFAVFIHLHRSEELSWITLGLMLAIQAAGTAAYLKKQVKRGMAASIWLTIVLLAGFGAFNIFRSVHILLRGLGPKDVNAFESASVIIYLATALGLGFTVFWMASMQLRLELEQLASTDPLTGLYNRRSFLFYSERELLRSARTREPLSLVLLDLDYFKQINDSHGHDGGDAALCAVASKLKGAVRDNDILGRWGGEEFIVLLPGADAEQALLVAERLRSCVEAISLTHQPKGRAANSGCIALAMSAGVTTGYSPIESLDALLRSCDEALYSAKAGGRNRVVQRELRHAVEVYRSPLIVAQAH